MKSLFTKFLLLTFFVPAIMFGQVTIGDKAAPHNYSLLELSTKNYKGGVRLPQFTISQRDSLTNVAKLSSDTLANGLMIFNKNSAIIEFWDGTKWSSSGGSSQLGAYPIKTITADYVLDVADYKILATAPNSNNIKITLPKVSVAKGYIYVFQNMNTNGGGLTFDQNINISGSIITAGALACLPLIFGNSYSNGSTLLIQSDGSQWVGITQ